MPSSLPSPSAGFSVLRSRPLVCTFRLRRLSRSAAASRSRRLSRAPRPTRPDLPVDGVFIAAQHGGFAGRGQGPLAMPVRAWHRATGRRSGLRAAVAQGQSTSLVRTGSVVQFHPAAPCRRCKGRPRLDINVVSSTRRLPRRRQGKPPQIINEASRFSDMRRVIGTIIDEQLGISADRVAYEGAGRRRIEIALAPIDQQCRHVDLCQRRTQIGAAECRP